MLFIFIWLNNFMSNILSSWRLVIESVLEGLGDKNPSKNCFVLCANCSIGWLSVADREMFFLL